MRKVANLLREKRVRCGSNLTGAVLASQISALEGEVRHWRLALLELAVKAQRADLASIREDAKVAMQQVMAAGDV
jgi:hypothetical protein